jgi:pimeloyl-ACP methyl ester carboxylesterase
LHFDDELLDAQLLRVAGSAVYGGADIGECLAAARRVRGTDLSSWHDAWRELGERVSQLARSAEQEGRLETARAAFLRASSYHRTAGVMLLGAPPDPRLIACNRAQTEAFAAAARLAAWRSDAVEIPYEGGSLPGRLLLADDAPGRRATVILIGGYDCTAEELYVLNGAAALARGYHVLTFDGPGQGAALLQRGLHMRSDWETVIAAVLDVLLARSEVDADRVALVGLSLGAHLAPRAAAHEHRVAACIADCGSFDLYAAALERMPGRLADGLRDGRRWARAVAGVTMRVLARKPTAGWALRRGMLVHGAATPLAYIDSLREFDLAGHAGLIRCPTWVCNAEEDDIGASAPQLFAALQTADKEFVRFRSADGAGDHCEQGARTLFHARAFGWLDGVLEPGRVA